MLPVILAVIISAFLFSALFYYLFRVHKRLQIRHAKPPPNAIPPGLEEHHELAFVLAHGVEAYNQLRRQRQQEQRQTDRSDDNASTASSSSHPSITAAAAIEPPPAYTASPVDGDVGYGWRASGQTSIFGPPQVITSSSIPNSLPPVYIYQSPTTRSSVQTALLTSDNSPVVSVAGHRPNMRRNSSRGATSVEAPVNDSSIGHAVEVAIAEEVEDGEQQQHETRIVNSESTLAVHGPLPVQQIESSIPSSSPPL